jgi:hypothetical protein
MARCRDITARFLGEVAHTAAKQRRRDCSVSALPFQILADWARLYCVLLDEDVLCNSHCKLEDTRTTLISVSRGSGIGWGHLHTALTPVTVRWKFIRNSALRQLVPPCRCRITAPT